MVLCDAEFLRTKTPFRIVKNREPLSVTSPGTKNAADAAFRMAMIGCVDSGRPLYFGQNVPLQNIWRLALQGRGYEQIDRIDETGAELAGQRVRDAVDLRAQPHGDKRPAGTCVDVRTTEKVLGCECARLVVA